MDYEKLKKPANVLKNSKYHDDQKTAINASIPKIANAQKAQWPDSQIHNNQAENHEFEQKSNNKNNEKVATLSLNVFTETFSRSEITRDELKDGQVGHTWISLKFYNPKSALKYLDNPTRTLVKKEGKTSMGFWPLKYRPEAFITQGRDHRFTTNQERDSGCTPGAGASQDTSHSGFSFEKSVPGRVEEPDRVHQKEIKIKKEYDLTHEQVKSMMKYVNKSRNNDYNLYHYNCTTFAVESVKAAGQTAPSGSKYGICFPNVLYKELYQNSKRDKRIIVEPFDTKPHSETGRLTDVMHGDETE